jgi:hypothetical protein
MPVAARSMIERSPADVTSGSLRFSRMQNCDSFLANSIKGRRRLYKESTDVLLFASRSLGRGPSPCYTFFGGNKGDGTNHNCRLFVFLVWTSTVDESTERGLIYVAPA